MYLNVMEQFLTRGRAVSSHLMVVRKTPGGTGYVITPGFAQQALEAAKDPNHNSWFDILFEVRLLMMDCPAVQKVLCLADSRQGPMKCAPQACAQHGIHVQYATSKEH
jgi:hypothetical protein